MGLNSKMNFALLIKVALLGVAGILLLQLLEKFLAHKNELYTAACISRFDMLVAQRTLHMDYEQLDSPLVNDIRNRMQIDKSSGWSFDSVFFMLQWIASSLFSIAGAVIILIPMMAQDAVSGNPVVWIFLLIFIALMAGAILYKLKGRNAKIFALAAEFSKEKSYFRHFVWGETDYHTGKDLRIFGGAKLIKHYVDRDVPGLWRFCSRYSRAEGKGMIVNGAWSGLRTAGSYLCAVLIAAGGALTVGAMLKFAAAIDHVLGDLYGILDAISQLSVIARRQMSTLEYLNVPDVLYKGTLSTEKRDDNDYEVEFDHVSFRYPGGSQWALRDFSLKLRVGQQLAVVGMNGSGKTTMIKLLCRLYDPQEGRITLNGIDIRKYNETEYRALFSVVFQDFKLFSFPLGQNVASSRQVDEIRAKGVLEQAGLDQWLKTLSQGLKTPLYQDYDKGGVEISGGEAQKIALARALYKDAPFIVLDEPTAALDPIAEYEIYDRFSQLVGQRTTIYISHRLSSCRFLDDIAVFDQGRLIQRGSHEALLADKKGKYHELWMAQAQYYNETA